MTSKADLYRAITKAKEALAAQDGMTSDDFASARATAHILCELGDMDEGSQLGKAIHYKLAELAEQLDRVQERIDLASETLRLAVLDHNGWVSDECREALKPSSGP